MAFTGKTSITSNITISNDGFWPDVTVGELLDSYRIPSEYADDVIKTGLLLSVARVNEQLAAAKTAVLALGYATLAAYCAAFANTLNGEDLIILHYKTAVFSRAKAFLLKQFNTLNQKPEAENAAKTADETEYWWLNQAQQALAAINKLLAPLNEMASSANVQAALL